MTNTEFDEHWPRYPSNDSGKSLMDLVAECEVDKLFKLQWDPASEFLAKSQEVRGNKDFVSTPWVSTSDEVEEAAKTANTAKPQQELKLADYQGKLRKTTCNSFGMGMKFQTFEIQRCVEAKEGEQYVINTCVMTTATYGEKFRPCFKYTLKADGEKKCRLKVEYQLVYVTSVNAFIKKAIERGATNGITKNFETVQDVLKDFVDIHEPGKAKAPAKAATPSTKPEDKEEGPGPSQPQAPRQPWWTGVMDRRFVGSFEPLATWLKSTVSSGGTQIPKDGVSMTATCLAAGLMIFAIYLLRSITHGVHAWLTGCRGVFGSIFRLMLGWADIPDSLCEVVISFALLVVTHSALRALASFVTQHLKDSGQLRPPVEKAIDADGPDGTRYDGYDAAYGKASTSMAEEGSDSGSPSGNRGDKRVRHRDVWNQQIKESNEKTKQQIKHGFKEFRRMMTDSWNKHEERKEARRDRRHSRNNSDVSVDNLDTEVKPSATSTSSNSAAVNVNGSSASATASGTASSKSLASASAPAKAPAPVPSRPQTASSEQPPSPASPVKEASPPKPVKTQAGSSSGTVTSTMKPLLEKTDNVLASWGFSRGNTMQHSKPEEAGLAKSDSASNLEASSSVTSVVTPLLEKTDNVLASWGLTSPASSDTAAPVQVSSPSARSAGPSVTGKESDVPAAKPGTSFTSVKHSSSPTHSQLSQENLSIHADRHATYSESELAEAETGPVEEEMFENERVSPFKGGWGHDWPGHFLPTDKVGHWSDRSGGPGGAASMNFSSVAPKLPKGWSWVEQEWVTDTQGIADDAVDMNGWSYARDFHKLTMPPAANSGKYRKIRDFVRRRRWLRHRVRKAQEPDQAASGALPSQPAPAPAQLSAESAALSRASASSSGTGPIYSRPTHIFAAPERSANGSFTSQHGGSQVSPSKDTATGLRDASFSSHPGSSPSRAALQEGKPGTSLADAQQGLSTQCNKWGNAVVNELHRAISSVEGDGASTARDSVHSDDYVGNSPMAAGLTRLSGPSQASQPSGLSTITSSSQFTPNPALQGLSTSSNRFVRESTPQTLGTAGAIPVAPQLAEATGHASIADAGASAQGFSRSRLSNTPLFGHDAVQHPQAQDFPSAEEFTPERSVPSAPTLSNRPLDSPSVGQVRHGRLQVSDDGPLAAFPASTVAAGIGGPGNSQTVMQDIDRQSGRIPGSLTAESTPTTQASSSAGHHHAYEKPGVVVARPDAEIQRSSQ